MAESKKTRCSKCFYYEHVYQSYYGCFYILYAKKMRGCPPERCTKFLPKGRKNTQSISLRNMALGERGML